MERLGLRASWNRTDAKSRSHLASRAEQISAFKQELAAQYDRLRQPVFRYLLSIRLEAAECEDIIQETFVRAFKDLVERPEAEHNVRAWVFRVAHNLAISHKKRNGRITYGLDLSNLESLPQSQVAPSAEEELLQQEQIDRTRTAMASLTAQELQCIQLRAEGLRYREIAIIVGTGISSVAEAVARGCRKLAP